MKIKQIELYEDDFKVIEALILKDFEKKLRLLGDTFSFSLDNQVSLHKLSSDSIKLETPFNLNCDIEFEFEGSFAGEELFFDGEMDLTIMDDDGSTIEWVDTFSFEKMCNNIDTRLKEIIFS